MMTNIFKTMPTFLFLIQYWETPLYQLITLKQGSNESTVQFLGWSGIIKQDQAQSRKNISTVQYYSLAIITEL